MRSFNSRAQRRPTRVASRFGGVGGTVLMVMAAAVVLGPVAGAAEPTAGDQSSTAPSPAAEPLLPSPAAEPLLPSPVAELPAAPAGPQLNIGVDNGKTSVTTGDTLDYVITIQNLGAEDLDGLQVSQTMPTGMTFVTADSGGTVEASNVTWQVDLKAASTATVRTTMNVADTPAELLRLATVACASTSADSAPIVCATHSDQLPAGAKAQADQASMQSAAVSQPAPGTVSWWYIAAGAVVVVLLGGLTLWWLAKRRRSMAAAP